MPLRPSTRGDRVVAATAAVIAALALTAAAVVALAQRGGPARAIVLVSGLDDHGLPADETVDLLDAPDGRPVGAVAAGTLARVVGTRAEWLRVEALEGPGLRGWVNDYHLRGTLHLVGDPPGCPVALRDHAWGRVVAAADPSLQVEVTASETGPDGELWFHVRGVADPEVTGTVPRSLLAELPGPAARPGPGCAEVEPDPASRPHRH